MRTRLPYVTYTILEHARQKDGMCTVHAAGAVRPKGGAVLLFGDKGSGKTSLLLALLARNYVAAGDDLLVLQVGRNMALRSGNRISRRRAFSGVGGGYEAKQPFNLDQSRFLDGSEAVDKIYRISVHAANQPGINPMPDETREALRLHENLARYIHGVPTPLLFRGAVPIRSLPSLDSVECMRTRASLIRAILNWPIKYLSGRTADEAADLVEADGE